MFFLAHDRIEFCQETRPQTALQIRGNLYTELSIRLCILINLATPFLQYNPTESMSMRSLVQIYEQLLHVQVDHPSCNSSRRERWRICDNWCRYYSCVTPPQQQTHLLMGT